MSEGDVAQDGQTAGNAIVAVSSIFAPGEVVTLRRREEGEMRPGAGEVVGRRTVDENGLVGFVGFEQDELFWACGYSAGSPMNVRCVAKDPAEAIVFFQPAVQPSPLSTGTAGTRPVAVPPAEPDTPTEGTGIPAGAVEAAEGAQSGTPAEPDLVTAGAEDESAPAAPVDDPNPAAPDAGSPDSSESSGTGQANGGAIEQAPAVEQPPAPDGTTTADGSPQPADGAAATAVDAPASEPAAVTDTAAAADAAPLDGAPADTPSDAPADAAQSSDASAPAAAADSSSSAAAPAVDQPAGADDSAAWQQLLEQANGLGVENAATLSDAELRQAITEKGAAPVA